MNKKEIKIAERKIGTWQAKAIAIAELLDKTSGERRKALLESLVHIVHEHNGMLSLYKAIQPERAAVMPLLTWDVGTQELGPSI